ncbi:MAG: hypothetical protein EAZ55_11040 [Cytophagales bacterium]|nr:MAG: hypothetical protein EAZ55_11040 [Cytophagales bacterium]
MKKTLLYPILLFFVCSISLKAQNTKIQNQIDIYKKNKVKVTVLGVAHFDNPGQDVMNLKFDDVLAEKRQKEIQLVAEKLKEFQPTKIMVEVPPSYQNQIDQKYQAYLANNTTLNRNEVQQIGFRLAKMLNHQKLYCIDMNNDWFFDSLMVYAESKQQTQLIMTGFAEVQKSIQEDQAFLQAHTIGEYLLKINQQEIYEKSNAFYLSLFSRIGEGENYIGTELNVEWYRRNMKIFTNVLRLAEENDRILIIFGQGHVRLLQLFFQDTFDFEYINVDQYLK